MTERLDLFATPILKARHPQADALNAALKATIDRRRAEDPAGIARSNHGGWHSDTDMLGWGGEPALALAEFAGQAAGGHLKDVATTKRDFTWRCEMWTNINPPGASNQMHCHPFCLWSGVYYVDPGGADTAKSGGELVLEDPRFPMAYNTVPDLLLTNADGTPMRSQTGIRPQAGLLVLFPSWLRHSVRPHPGPGERISVALNLSVVPA